MTAVIDADEFACPGTKMILRDEDGQSEERDLTSTDGDELPTRPIYIFRDLRLSEGTNRGHILGAGSGGIIANSAMSLPRSARWRV